MKDMFENYVRVLESRAKLSLCVRAERDTKQDVHLELMGEYNALCRVISDFTGEHRHDVAKRLRKEAKL